MTGINQRKSNTEVDLNNEGGLKSLSVDDNLVSSSSSRLRASDFANLLRYKKQFGLENKKKFLNFGRLKEKDQPTALDQVGKKVQIDMANNNKSHLMLISDRARNVDPGMDFLDTSKKVALNKLYLSDPVAMPAKEVKPLKFNNMDKFASDVQLNADLIGNASILLAKAIDEESPQEAMFHVDNILDISRNLRSESTLKRIGIKDPKSATILKRHVDGSGTNFPSNERNN
jgi:hypothetical protein